MKSDISRVVFLKMYHFFFDKMYPNGPNGVVNIGVPTRSKKGNEVTSAVGKRSKQKTKTNISSNVVANVMVNPGQLVAHLWMGPVNVDLILESGPNNHMTWLKRMFHVAKMESWQKLRRSSWMKLYVMRELSYPCFSLFL